MRGKYIVCLTITPSIAQCETEKKHIPFYSYQSYSISDTRDNLHRPEFQCKIPIQHYSEIEGDARDAYIARAADAKSFIMITRQRLLLPNRIKALSRFLASSQARRKWQVSFFRKDHLDEINEK